LRNPINANEPVLVLYNTPGCINPVIMKKMNIKTVIVKLSDLLYLIVIYIFVLAHSIININTYTTILIRAFEKKLKKF
jgi:hypothetical protein